MNQMVKLFTSKLNKQVIEMNGNSFDREKIFSLTKNFSLIFLATWMVDGFDIEGDLQLPTMMVIVCIAFIVNALLPVSYRLFFFFIASLVPIFYFFSTAQAFTLIGIALALIGVCHLPFSITIRQLLVIFLGMGLAFCQYIIKKTSFVGEIALGSKFVSLLGVMFMFRIILYLHELKYQKKKPSVWQSLSYFFTLPNYSFPIFPIIDFKAFNSTYYDDQDTKIYERGVNLILLGLFQLLFYRVIYYLLPLLSEVDGALMFFYYIMISYLFLIRLNGILNIIVGILRLFGFNLPDIFNYMFLSHGFDDYWRRVNIYWKDFMVKIFYYPIYFKFRKKSIVLALTIGTILTFFFNWFLHSYQWFWILGEFSVRGPEIIFWTILCILVLIAVIYQTKNRGKTKISKINIKTWKFAFTRALQIIFTNVVIALIYNLYNSPSFSDWINLLTKIKNSPIIEIGIVLLILLLIVFPLALGIWMYENKKMNSLFDFISRGQDILKFGFLIGGLFITTSFAGNLLSTKNQVTLYNYVTHQLNKSDTERQSRGYYEEILSGDQFNSQAWQNESGKSANWVQLNKTGIMVREDLFINLKPNAEIVFKDAHLSTNSWGMRDKEYSKKRPKNTVRIAILGGSLEMGTGVENNEVFENLIENSLNANKKASDPNYEVLNFSISGSSIIRNIEKFNKQVKDFEPTHVLLGMHEGEVLHFQKTLRWIKEQTESKENLENIFKNSPWLRELVIFIEKENLSFDLNIKEKEKIKRGNKIINWCLNHLKQKCSEKGIDFSLILFPSLENKTNNLNNIEQLIKKNKIHYYDIRDAYLNYDHDLLKIAEWDNHPNTKGHELIANALYLEINKKKLNEN
ncbi:SGNH/GDSL hydrolase family protein [Dokdonia ponticola]|uniref:SGNH/GDSL hydrolase family protein n=1 Tax=Dokdonia ponticola TaxID=2041041 RepID=A0ABV9HWL3_9FLAO